MPSLGERIAKIPVARSLLRWVVEVRARRAFAGSERYWQERYANGGTSGAGSCGRLAGFKAQFVNSFVREFAVRSVIEHGCGDGNQLALAEYPRYLGLDVSPAAVGLCRRRFAADPTKEFRLVQEYRGERADLALSLDVIFHLVEDEVFERYMSRLFASAERFVVIYSSDTDDPGPAPGLHVRHRRFSRWVERHAPQWRSRARVPNPFPFDGDVARGSFSDFHVYERFPP